MDVGIEHRVWKKVWNIDFHCKNKQNMYGTVVFDAMDEGVENRGGMEECFFLFLSTSSWPDPVFHCQGSQEANTPS